MPDALLPALAATAARAALLGLAGGAVVLLADRAAPGARVPARTAATAIASLAGLVLLPMDPLVHAFGPSAGALGWRDVAGLTASTLAVALVYVAALVAPDLLVRQRVGAPQPYSSGVPARVARAEGPRAPDA